MAEVENPNKLDEITVKKIEEALSMDCTIKEVCLYAGISKQTFYNWTESFPELKERFDLLRETPVLKARQTVVNSLTNPEHAFKYLERKKKKEFGNNVDITSDNKPIPMLYALCNNDSHNENTPDDQEDQGGTGRNISE